MESVSNTKTHGITVNDLKKKHNKAEHGPLGQQVSAAAHEKNEAKKTERVADTIKQQSNEAILKSSLELSVSAGNEPMALLFKAAFEGINDVLKAEFGDNAIQSAYESELDVSPEATADRIVSMSTAFFSQYQAQNPEMSEQEAAKNFSEIIAGGIDQGFAEAKDILTALDVLEGEIADNIDTTYDLVQKGLQAFVDSFSEPEEEIFSES